MKSARIADKTNSWIEYIKIIIHVYQFLKWLFSVHLLLFTTHLAPNIMIGPTKASGVILNPNILHECRPTVLIVFFLKYCL